MRRATGAGRRRTALAVGLLCLATAGCAGMPTSGPVRDASAGAARSPERDAAAIDPARPAPGASPAAIVSGFLNAMEASPTSTAVAKLYLTDAAAAAWDPTRSTITYAEHERPVGTASFAVQLVGADLLDARGAWKGPLSEDDSVLRLSVVMEDGEYRITNPPDALVVPQSWFDQRYRQVSLYFVDPASRLLVPEPVFLPDDDQLASTLVDGLLRGPQGALRRVETTYLPSSLGVSLSVPVSSDGVARVDLSGGSIGGEVSLDRVALAQLAWTLRQDPRVQAVAVSVAGRPVRLPGGVDQFGVDEGDVLDPTGFQASPFVYALRQGLLVSGTPEALDPVDGPWGRDAPGLRSVTVDVNGARAAGVDLGGTRLLTAPVRGDAPASTTAVLTGTDLLRPAWDLAGRLWVVDAAPGGAVVHVVHDAIDQVVRVPGVSGRRVVRLLVSRDGSRLVALVRTGRGDLVRVARIEQGQGGRVLGATRAIDVAPEPEEAGARLLDIAWRGPTTLAVLTRLTSASGRVTTVVVDGAPTGLDSVTTTVTAVKRLVGSPDPTQPLYALVGDRLADLTGAGRPPVTVGRLGSLGYAG